MKPIYDLDKIKFATDEGTYMRAVELYEKGKVTKFKSDFHGCSAVVLGSKPYEVMVSETHYDRGSCDCYLGQQNILCKHMVAVAIYAILGGNPIKNEDKELITLPVSSGKLGELNKEKLSEVKELITESLRCIKSYSGPSRTWFAYQNSLQEGCSRLSALISGLPVNKQTAQILVDMLLRLDNKLCRGGVDDSDGVIGTFIEETVEVLKKYAKLDPGCKEAFIKLKDKETCFGWEEPLLNLIKI